MKVEHIAFVVDDPDAVAAWYCKHMGLKLVRQGPPPVKMTFLADDSGQTMFAVYSPASVETPDYASMNPLILHFAYYSEDIHADFKRLQKAGATVVLEPSKTDAGDTLAMLRDPWGVAVQLVNRKVKMM
jgi:glyoxylase I family protein